MNRRLFLSQTAGALALGAVVPAVLPAATPATPPPPPPPAAPPSAFDIVIGFFEAVFNGSVNESPEHKAMIKGIIESAFDPNYTFNGGKMAPDALVGWREAMLKQFGTIAFRVNTAVSWDVNLGPATGVPTTAVCITWTATTQDSQNRRFKLNGMNMLSLSNGKALSNVQLGDAGTGWQPA